jgi:hypothetical protein
MDALLARMHDSQVTYHRYLEFQREHVISQQLLDDAESNYKQTAGDYNAARQGGFSP